MRLMPPLLRLKDPPMRPPDMAASAGSAVVDSSVANEAAAARWAPARWRLFFFLRAGVVDWLFGGSLVSKSSSSWGSRLLSWRCKEKKEPRWVVASGRSCSSSYWMPEQSRESLWWCWRERGKGP